MNSILILLLLSKLTFSESRTNLFKKEVVISTDEKKPISIKKDNQLSKPKNSSQISDSNLPKEYFSFHKFVSIEESPIVVPINRAGIRFKDLKVGDLIQASITESVFAFSDSKTPVRAVITSGKLQGSVFVGEASLERNSKRILIEFKKFRDPNQKDIFQIQASMMDLKGIYGLEGKLISNEGKYFSAEILSAAAAGYVDSTISRDQNAFGNQVDSRTEDTFAKKALVSALSKSADRFSEKLKQAPEYSILVGPIDIQILILDQPKQTNE